MYHQLADDHMHFHSVSSWSSLFANVPADWFPIKGQLFLSTAENLELIEQGKAGLPTERPDSPIEIKCESPTPVSTPVKQEPQLRQVEVKVKQESAVMVKTDPDLMFIDLKDMANLGHGLNLDAGLTDIALQVPVSFGYSILGVPLS